MSVTTRIFTAVEFTPQEQEAVAAAERVLANLIERLQKANRQQFEIAAHWKARFDLDARKDVVSGFWSVTPNDMLKRGSGGDLPKALRNFYEQTDVSAKRRQLERLNEASEKLRNEIASLEGEAA